MSAVENVYVKDRMGLLVKILSFNEGSGKKYSFLKPLKERVFKSDFLFSILLLVLTGLNLFEKL